MLASLAATIYRKAYEEGGPWIGFVTAAGFLTSFLLGSAA